MDSAYNILYFSLIFILGVLILLAIIKSIIGPKTADRIVSINMASTLIVMIIATLTVKYQSEGYLADVAIIYVLISFIAVVVLASVFINVNLRNKYKNEKKEEK